MLGNFSFGDYFKEQRDRARLEPGHQGLRAADGPAAGHGLHEDDEAAALWRKIAGLPDERIIRIPTSDNFWRMGDTGPCGPCSRDLLRPRRPTSPAARPAARTRTATASSKSGTWCSCSSRRARPARACRCRGPRSTPAWGWSASPPSCRASTTTTTPTLFRALIQASAEATGQDPDGPHQALSHRVIADHLRSTALPDRRRRAALQRGPRLRAAPDHAPRHAPRPHDGRAASR